MPFETVMASLQAASSEQSSAISACTNAWLRRIQNRIVSSPELSPTVRVTARQWIHIITDSYLIEVWALLDDRIEQVAEVALLPKSEIGKTLFSRLESMAEAHAWVHHALVSIGRFVPPDSYRDGPRIIGEMQSLADGILTAIIDLLTHGIEGDRWSVFDQLFEQRDGLLDSLWSEAISGEHQYDELPPERTLGLSSERMSGGDGRSFVSRHMVIWSPMKEELDGELRVQLPHLIDENSELNPDVRRHLTGLLATQYPVSAHAAAVAGRDLTLAALAADPAACLSIIDELVNEESGMYTTFQQIKKAVAAINAGERPEDKMDPACELYLRVMEGDVRRTSRLVLGLIGERISEKATLGPIGQKLTALSNYPGCALLLTCINRSWRNSIAHSKFVWDPINQCISTSDGSVEISDLVDAAIRAHDIAIGFNAGLEVALNQAGNPHHWHSLPTDLTARDGIVMRQLGDLGIEVLGIRRYRTTVEISVPPLTPQNLRDHLVGILCAGKDVPHAEDWIIKQVGRPDILLDAETLEAASLTSESVEGGRPAIHPHSAELVLYAGALLKSGQEPKQVIRAVLGFATSNLLGERRLLLPRMMTDFEGAANELSETFRRVIDGVDAASLLLPKLECQSLVEFTDRISKMQGSLNDLSLDMFIQWGVIDRLFWSNTPIVLPWLEVNE